MWFNVFQKKNYRVSQEQKEGKNQWKNLACLKFLCNYVIVMRSEMSNEENFC